ncbi:1-aminocyclopropane-1-carboxylate synthase [Trifolium repens]|nr:1-aminocyclopropane-1-carboxylate synthase [Trifolium repens]
MERKQRKQGSPSLRNERKIINAKSKQGKESKGLPEMPSFSIGLTPSDDDKRNKNDSLSDSDQKNDRRRGKQKNQKKNEQTKETKTIASTSRGRTKRANMATQDSDEASSGEENVKQVMEKKDPDADARLRHKMSVPKVYELMQSINAKKRKKEIIGQLKECGFGGIMHICDWKRIHTFFVDWVVKRFEHENMWIRLSDTEVLMLKEDDVHRVYELPRAGKKINTDLCSEGAIKRLRKELGFIGDYSPIAKVAELENSLKTIENPKTWVKGAICYIIHNILCPTNRGNVSLQYADILEDPARVSSYNWCSHVLHYMKKGLQSPDVLNPLADFHFLMINYMEKMGKRSPFLTGEYNRPSLRGWNVKLANQELQKIHDIMGLENGLTAGVTRLDNGLPSELPRLNRTVGSPIVLCFDADTCPLSKAEMYLDHCRSCINIYTKTAETLQRRITDANAGTSGKDSPIEKEGENERNKSKEAGRLNDDDEDVKKRTQAKERLSTENDEEDDKSIDEEDNDEEDQTTPNLIDDAVPAACNIIDDSVKVTANEHDNYEANDEDDEIAPKIIDDAVMAACNITDHSVKLTPNAGLTLTQETIMKFPEYFDQAEASNKNVSVSQGAESATLDSELIKDADVPQVSVSQDTESATHATILNFPQYFEEPNQCRALVLVPNVLPGEKSKECDSEIECDSDTAINATPIKTLLPDEIIDIDNVTPKKRKRHNVLYSDRTYPERRRMVKKSKYLESPYDDAVHESSTTELQKQLSSYAWSPELDQYEDMYCSNNKDHAYSLRRDALWTLQKDEWVSCLVINSWVNCLNWDQQGSMTKLVTPLLNYFDQEKMPPVTRSIACMRFLERLNKFNYMQWKTIDPEKLEYIMTPAMVGNPGSHYVCFVVNLKHHKFQFLNSLSGVGEKLETKDGEATSYKKLFNVWVNEVEAFVAELYKQRKMKMPYEFITFTWDTPKVPTQSDSNNCGVFCMKFLAEWGGGWKSLKGWTKLKKHERVAKIMDLRIDICSEILSHPSNSIKDEVKKLAISYHEQLLQKMPSGSVRNH